MGILSKLWKDIYFNKFVIVDQRGVYLRKNLSATARSTGCLG